MIVEHFEGGAAFFNTFSEHRYLENGETVFKLFSPEKLTNEQLETLFVNTSWVYHKAWHAFPRLYPIQQDDNTFAPFILKANEDDESGIVYTGAFETFISVSQEYAYTYNVNIKYIFIYH